MKWLYWITSMVFFGLTVYSIEKKDYDAAVIYGMITIIDMMYFSVEEIKNYINKNK